ncbi:hypothetical protein HIM_06787 [Hirsutella minnesotensis 3608]|uniref:Uncharacterized protein n=1 Tax=Hirsutella minnesotensis 3608 TaxID=1043627 RepID=A0A0F8A4N6_9HYPO|nr:hypothetical protein HIM_06787 [Hirsutella minnesotensis 3608]
MLCLRPGPRSLGFAPAFQAVHVTFEKNATFSAPPSPASNAAWNSILPQGRGFVLVPDPKAYNLGPGIPTGAGPDRYGLSMFHQLHCLVSQPSSHLDHAKQHKGTSLPAGKTSLQATIRDGYFAALANKDPKRADETAASEDMRKPERVKHMGHCFDMLRQAIMCAGDMTLEPAQRSPSGEVLPSVDGWGVVHECRSWDEAVAWTLRHRAEEARSEDE